jgi:hypothetical protein
MTLKSRARKIVAKYGFTYRAFFVAMIVFPPVAVYLAWRLPNLHFFKRLSLSLLALVAPAVPPILMSLGVFKFILWAAGWK